MSAVVARLKKSAEEAAQRAERLQRMVQLVDALGEEGLAELVAFAADEQGGNGHSETNGNGAKPAPEGPRGRAAVRIIVRERPGIWTLKELRAEMEQRGWFTSASGLEAAVKRLCAVNREGRRVGTGRYAFPANYGEEDAIESDRSGVAMITPPSP
jgi:hypothetical protein